MLPNHHLPQLITNRINSAVTRLGAATWTDRTAVYVEASRAQPKLVPLAEGKKLKRSKVKSGTFWGRLFDQRWCRVELPEVSDGNTWLEWKDQSEATLYVEDKPYFGFNIAHPRCRLPEGIKEVWVQSSCIQSAIGHPDATGIKDAGSYFQGAYVVKRDDLAWGGYHDLKCLLDLSLDQRNREDPNVPSDLIYFGQQPPLERFTPFYRRLLRGMDDAVNELDKKGV